MDVPKLSLDWAERRWTDPLTGMDVVCLSPNRKSHFRNTYFRWNMFTGDGKYVVFIEFEDIRDGREIGRKRLWARNLVTGELIDLGEVSSITSWGSWAASRYSHRMNVIDGSSPEALAIIQIDIDTRERRRIVPSEKLPSVYEATFSADERYIYTPLYNKEKRKLAKTMSPAESRAMMAAQPGYHEMVRINLDTGAVEHLFSATTWQMGHPNPHPVYPNLFMCCQEWAGEDEKSRWGRAKEHERIRVIDLDTKQWLDIHRRIPFQSTHEHWALAGKRIYAHGGLLGTHAINRIDLEKGENTWSPCQPNIGSSVHVMVAPNERFLVGDGHNFDKYNMPADVRRRIEELAKRPEYDSFWFTGDLQRTNGGETIWKYELPAETLWNYETYDNDANRFHADLAKYPEKAVKTTPICRFRTLSRAQMLGYRLESNAHVTPDSRWAVFQSSSEDNWFQVWAARVPGTE